jgi:hypothetical protein
MNGKNIILIVLGLVLSVLTFVMSQKNDVVEGWGWGAGNPSFKWKTMTVTQSPGKAPQTMLSNSFIGNLSDDRFVKTTNMQSLLSPRFDNSAQTTNIRYSPPALRNMASEPYNPLMSADMATENYSPSCGAGGSAPARSSPFGTAPPGFTAGDYQQTLQTAVAENTYSTATDILPLGTMSDINSEGAQTNPVVYKQFIAAGAKSRLRAHGDMIRGDLAIAPNVGQWFNVSVVPSLDLQAGAINVMAGNTNESGNKMANLIAASAGTANIPIAGVADPFFNNNSQSMVPKYAGLSSALGADVNVQSGYNANLQNVRVSNMA